MPTATSMIPAVSLGDPQFTANVHDGIARITELINSELSQADEVMRDTVAHLVDAGGTRLDRFSRCLRRNWAPTPTDGRSRSRGQPSS